MIYAEPAAEVWEDLKNNSHKIMLIEYSILKDILLLYCKVQY